MEEIAPQEVEIQEVETQEEKPKKQKKCKVLKIVIVLVVIIVTAVFVFQPNKVVGEFETTAIEDGQVLFTENVSLLFSDPKVGDIVVYRYLENDIFPKIGVIIDILSENPLTYQISSAKHNQSRAVEREYVRRKVLFHSATSVEIQRLCKIHKQDDVSKESVKLQKEEIEEINKDHVEFDMSCDSLDLEFSNPQDKSESEEVYLICKVGDEQSTVL